MAWGCSITGFEDKDHRHALCWLCGGQIGSENRRWWFCSKECRDWYFHYLSWREAAWWCLGRAHKQCGECGITERGIRLLYDSVRFGYRAALEVHHIEPMNGEDRSYCMRNMPHNLIALCPDCHDAKRTKAQVIERREAQNLQGVMSL